MSALTARLANYLGTVAPIAPPQAPKLPALAPAQEKRDASAGLLARQQDEIARLRAEVERLNSALKTQAPVPAPARKLRNEPADPYATPAKALAAWYACFADPLQIPGWRKSVHDDFARLPRAEFRARMERRIEEARALEARRVAFVKRWIAEHP